MDSTTSLSTPSELRDRQEIVSRLQSSEVFRDYQRAFQSITGLPLVLRAAGAFQLALQGASKANAFCAMMATRNKSCAACLDLQQRLETLADHKAGTVECFSEI